MNYYVCWRRRGKLSCRNDHQQLRYFQLSRDINIIFLSLLSPTVIIQKLAALLTLKWGAESEQLLERDGAELRAALAYLGSLDGYSEMITEARKILFQFKRQNFGYYT